MAKSRYDDLSLEDLERLQQDKMRERDALRDEMLEIKAAMDQKAADREAQRLLAGLPPGQVDAIARAARAQAQASARDA